MPTRKKSADRRASFTNNNNGNSNTSNEEDVQASATSTQTQYQPSTSPTAAFSVPPSAMVAAFHEYEFEEQEEDVPYDVALISCIVSLAIGFGTGYLV